MSCLSMGLREMILLVLLVRPTNRWREVGDRETLTALLSRLSKVMIYDVLTCVSMTLPVGGVTISKVGSVEAVKADNCGHWEVGRDKRNQQTAVLEKITFCICV